MSVQLSVFSQPTALCTAMWVANKLSVYIYVFKTSISSMRILCLIYLNGNSSDLIFVLKFYSILTGYR